MYSNTNCYGSDRSVRVPGAWQNKMHQFELSRVDPDRSVLKRTWACFMGRSSTIIVTALLQQTASIFSLQPVMAAARYGHSLCCLDAVDGSPKRLRHPASRSCEPMDCQAQFNHQENICQKVSNILNN